MSKSLLIVLLIAIEEAIAQAQWDAVDNRDLRKIYNPYAIEDLGQLGDGVPCLHQQPGG